MAPKKTKDMNYYEILNVGLSASQQQIDKAYRIGKFSYSHESMALYGLADEEERQAMKEKIEEAYKTLGNIRKRKKYDISILKKKTGDCENAYFRNSTEKLVIEDGEIKQSLWQQLKNIFHPQEK